MLFTRTNSTRTTTNDHDDKKLIISFNLQVKVLQTVSYIQQLCITWNEFIVPQALLQYPFTFYGINRNDPTSARTLQAEVTVWRKMISFISLLPLGWGDERSWVWGCISSVLDSCVLLYLWDWNGPVYGVVGGLFIWKGLNKTFIATYKCKTPQVRWQASLPLSP